jgi:hypothetical protein
LKWGEASKVALAGRRRPEMVLTVKGLRNDYDLAQGSFSDYGFSSRKNRFPLGGAIVTLFVPPLLVIVPP